MASNAQWLALANRMFNQTFSGQTQNTIVLTEAGTWDATAQASIDGATDTITKARVYDFTAFEQQSDSVQLTDRKVAFVNNPLNTNPSASNITCTVNGTLVTVNTAKLDEAGAVWTLHVSGIYS